MNRIMRLMTTGVALLAGLAGAVQAQLVDPAIAGAWSGRSTAAQITAVLSQDGSVRGAVVAPGVDCGYMWQMTSREVSVSTAVRFTAAGSASLVCLGRRPGSSTSVKIDATASQMRIEILGFTGALVRNGALLGAAGNRIVSPDIPGHWDGTSDGVHASLDLAVDGSFNGSVSGPGLSGCAFKGQLRPREAFDNDADSFSGLTLGTMSGCADATLNTSYVAFIGATPEVMSISFIRVSDERSVFEVEGMTRMSGAVSVGASAVARAGMWYVPNESGWGLSLTLGATVVRIPFVVLYVYSGSTPTWYVMPSGTWTADNRFEGDLYVTTGSDWRTPAFTPGSVNKTGRLAMTFTSNSAATLEYTIADSTGTRTVSQVMQKQAF